MLALLRYFVNWYLLIRLIELSGRDKMGERETEREREGGGGKKLLSPATLDSIARLR